MWYAVIISSKQRKTLKHIDEIVRQFLVDADLPVDILEIGFLMPKYGSGNFIEETHEHLPDDLGMVHKNELIAVP